MLLVFFIDIVYALLVKHKIDKLFDVERATIFIDNGVSSKG